LGKLIKRREERQRCGLTETAQRRESYDFSQFLKRASSIWVPRLLKEREEAACSLSTWRALAARLPRIKREEGPGDVVDRNVLTERDHAAASRRERSAWNQRLIEPAGGDDHAGRSADKCRLQCSSILISAANLFNQMTEGRAQGYLHDPRPG